MRTVGTAFFLPFSISLHSRLNLAALGRTWAALFFTSFTPAVSVLLRPLVVPPESLWQCTGTCQYCWKSPWFTFLNWMWPMDCWVKGCAVLVLLCNQENQDSSWIYTNQGSPAKMDNIIKQDGLPQHIVRSEEMLLSHGEIHKSEALSVSMLKCETCCWLCLKFTLNGCSSAHIAQVWHTCAISSRH